MSFFYLFIYLRWICIVANICFAWNQILDYRVQCFGKQKMFSLALTLDGAVNQLHRLTEISSENTFS